MATREQCIDGLALNLPHHVRHVVVAAVGDSRAKVGNLQRSEVDLTLSYAYAYDGQAIP